MRQEPRWVVGVLQVDDEEPFARSQCNIAIRRTCGQRVNIQELYETGLISSLMLMDPTGWSRWIEIICVKVSSSRPGDGRGAPTSAEDRIDVDSVLGGTETNGGPLEPVDKPVLDDIGFGCWWGEVGKVSV